MTSLQDRKLSARLAETVRRYYDLGFTAFGGPGVHVVILRRRFVEQLKWLDSTTFADLFTLGNALPGPGSTQLAFSIAIARNGALCGLVAFLLWSIPASAGMAGLAAGVRNFPPTLPPIVFGLLTGLNAAAVGLIALAAYQLSSAAVTDLMTKAIVLAAASFGICYHAPWMYPVLVAAGGIATLCWDYRLDVLSYVKSRRKPRLVQASTDVPPNVVTAEQDIELAERNVGGGERDGDLKDDAKSHSSERQQGASSQAPSTGSATASLRSRRLETPPATPPPETAPARIEHIMTPSLPLAVASGVIIVAFVIGLVVAKSKAANPTRALQFVANMALAGVIIFGGGPVVIPLLKGYTVDPGWVSPQDFLLGFAILQAFPGPNFAFACYLGVLSVPNNPALGAVLGFLGIFSPGIGLKLALLPVYNKWRKLRVARSILRGLNAAAAGLVYVAVWQLFLVGYIYKPVGIEGSASGPLTSDPFWGVVAATAFVAAQSFKIYPAFCVVGGALAGLAWFGVVGVAGTQR